MYIVAKKTHEFEKCILVITFKALLPSKKILFCVDEVSMKFVDA